MIEIIKITETQISSCLDDSRGLLTEARSAVNDARDAYNDVSRELSRLDIAYERLLVFVDALSQENIDLRPLVDRATEHAQQLQIQADELDRWSYWLNDWQVRMLSFINSLIKSDSFDSSSDLIDRLDDLLDDRSIWSIDLVNLTDRLIDRLIHWFIDSLIEVMID